MCRGGVRNDHHTAHCGRQPRRCVSSRSRSTASWRPAQRLMWTVKLDPPDGSAGRWAQRAGTPGLISGAAWPLRVGRKRGRPVRRPRAGRRRALRLCGPHPCWSAPRPRSCCAGTYGPAATGSPAGWRSPTGCARLPFCRPARPSGGPVGRCERAGEAASDIGDPRNSGIIQGSSSPPVGSIGRHSAAQFLEHCDMSANGCRIGGRPASRVPPVAAVLRRRGPPFRGDVRVFPLGAMDGRPVGPEWILRRPMVRRHCRSSSSYILRRPPRVGSG